MGEIQNVVILAIILALQLVSACNNQNPCLCEIDDYHRIDLSQLSSNLKIDEFLNDADDAGHNYYFHGCHDGDFNLTAHGIINGTVVKTSLLQIDTAKLTYTNSQASQLKFVKIGEEDHANYNLVYTNGPTVEATIQLLCVKDYNTSLIKFLPNDDTNAKLVLISPLACIIQHDHGMSTFSVFLLLLLIAFIIYFVGGCCVMYFIRGARGIEIIPNLDFWRSLPGKLKNGLIFLFSGCNTNTMTTTAETYDRI